METTGLHTAEALFAASNGRTISGVDAEVASFCDTVRTEHLRFLQAVGDASSRLGREHRELAQAAAVHGRLTRQFFDAQRSILLRRAEVAAEVLGIAKEAELSAAEVAAGARRRAAMMAHPAGSDPRPLVPVATEIPLQVGPLAGEPAALAAVMDQVFMPREADGVVEQRELASLLDGWWAAEQQEARAKIDDAHARSAMRQHVATVEATTLGAHDGGAVAVHDAAWAGSCHLPVAVSAVLDTAVAGDLSAVLDALIASLLDDSTSATPFLGAPPAPEPLREGAIIRFEPSSGITVATDDAFLSFWDTEPAAPLVAERPRWWQRAAFVLSAAAVSSSLFFISLAWIG
jgi:cell division septum initiation protein DivIVA